MESSLKPNEFYSLSRGKDSKSSKDLYFVKLTDSSIRAVEEYLQHKVSCFDLNSVFANTTT